MDKPAIPVFHIHFPWGGAKVPVFVQISPVAVAADAENESLLSLTSDRYVPVPMIVSIRENQQQRSIVLETRSWAATWTSDVQPLLDAFLAERGPWRLRLSPLQPILQPRFTADVKPLVMLSSLGFSLPTIARYAPYVTNVSPLAVLSLVTQFHTAKPSPITAPVSAVRVASNMEASGQTIPWGTLFTTVQPSGHVYRVQLGRSPSDPSLLPRRRHLYRQRLPQSLWALTESTVPAFLPTLSSLYLALWTHVKEEVVPTEIRIACPDEVPTMLRTFATEDDAQRILADPKARNILIAETLVHWTVRCMLALLGGFAFDVPRDIDMDPIEARALGLTHAQQRADAYMWAAGLVEEWTRPHGGWEYVSSG